MPTPRGSSRALTALFLVSVLCTPPGTALAQDETAAVEDESTPLFAHGYPVRFARRPLVLDEGMLRADARIRIGGAFGPGTFSSLDLGAAISPVDKLEVGLSTQLTGTVPAPGGIGLISGIFSPPSSRSYGDIPVYARYQYAKSDVAFAAVDLVLVLPSNTDFTLTAGLPLRIVELFGLFTMDMTLNIRYRNGDKYAAFITDPSKNSADFTFSGASVINITDFGYFEIGGGVGLVNVGGGQGAKNVVELPFFIGGGYTHKGKVLTDMFAQFGWDPLMTANAPSPSAPTIDTFNIQNTWFVTVGTSIRTEALFGKNKR
ncbi:MAG: hypothetical protein PVH76_13185 [Myxococcales bacterium]|jgi:hypothetical protein